jgi:hypothetical protein
MKKTALYICSAALFAAAHAHAQIAINWSSTSYFLQEGGDSANYPGDYLGSDAFHVLVWSASAAPEVAYAQATTGIGAGELVLWSSAEAPRGAADTREDSARFNYAEAPLVFEDADVGGADINAGYVYSRIFENSTAGVGDWYYQSQANLGDAIPEYDFQAPVTIQNHRTANASDTALIEMGVGAGMYQVIPEPSVMALLGFGGLVLAIRRRMTLA